MTLDFSKSDVICRSSVIGIRVQESQATRRIKLAYAWTTIGKDRQVSNGVCPFREIVCIGGHICVHALRKCF